MLNRKLDRFADLVWSAASQVGLKSGKITDRIIADAFPDSVDAAEREGCDKMLREGVLAAVRSMVRGAKFPSSQFHFCEIHESFAKEYEALSHATYFVPSLEEHVPIKVLLAHLELLDEARKYQRKKGLENLKEADLLDRLYEARVEHLSKGGAQ